MEHKKLKRIEDYDKNLPIVEVYTAVQSEGSRAGYPTVVIRTTGCTHRCYFGEGGCATVGTRQSTLKKDSIVLMLSLIHISEPTRPY